MNKLFSFFTSDPQKDIPKYSLSVSAKYTPKMKRGRKPECGQDSFFIAENMTEKLTFLGVADGVGGYDRKGIDSSVLANRLMSYCKKYALQNYNYATPFEREDYYHPKTLLSKAYYDIVHKQKIRGGGTTAVCVKFDQVNGNVDAINLGDSGFYVFRKDEASDCWMIIHKSSVQQHYFNCPFQLVIPPRSTKPSDGDVYQIEGLREEDMILLCSDGVSDNLFEEDMIDIIESQEGNDIEDVAEVFLQTAYENANNELYVSPFNIEEQKAKHLPVPRIGGKIDDITLILARVIPFDPSSNNCNEEEDNDDNI